MCSCVFGLWYQELSSPECLDDVYGNTVNCAHQDIYEHVYWEGLMSFALLVKVLETTAGDEIADWEKFC